MRRNLLSTNRFRLLNASFIRGSYLRRHLLEDRGGRLVRSIRWQWLRGEHLMSQRNGRQSNNSELVLNYLQRTDSSNYTCTVQNNMETDKLTYELIVQGNQL